MRKLVLVLATVAAVMGSAGAAQAKSCPLDAAKASLALWPEGVLESGKTLTGKHSCGKLLRCHNAKNKAQGRVCTWL